MVETAARKIATAEIERERLKAEAQACQDKVIELMRLPFEEREKALATTLSVARTMTRAHLDALPGANALNERLREGTEKVFQTGWVTETSIAYAEPWMGTTSTIAGTLDGHVFGHYQIINEVIAKSGYPELTGTVFVKWLLGLHIHKAIQEKRLPETEEIVEFYCRKYLTKLLGKKMVFGGTINRVIHMVDRGKQSVYDQALAVLGEATKAEQAEADLDEEISEVVAGSKTRWEETRLFVASNGTLVSRQYLKDLFETEGPKGLRGKIITTLTKLLRIKDNRIPTWTLSSRFDAFFVGSLATYLEEPDLEQTKGEVPEPAFAADIRAGG